MQGALGGAGLAIAGAASAGVAAPAQAAESAASHAFSPAWSRAGDQQFTVVIMPDTQYLFDGTGNRPAPVVAALDYVKRMRKGDNIAFFGHLGDLTQDGTEAEMSGFAAAFRRIDKLGVPWSAHTGNHDVNSRTDDTRGATPYLAHMRRRVGQPGVIEVSPDGYNGVHEFHAAGRTWNVIALDWRLSAAGFAWAGRMLDKYKDRPTILLTHELVDSTPEENGTGVLSEYGQKMWNDLIRAHDQVFLAIGGHFWPSARTVAQNSAGHDVQLHMANYQERYYGGGGMIRLYRFDLERKVVDVETLSPWVAGMDPAKRNELMEEELVVTGPADRFSFPLDPDTRFAAFAPAPVRAERPARAMLVPGTLAYWRADTRGGLDAGDVVRDLSGHGNDLVVVGNGASRLVAEAVHHPDQPAHHAVKFAAGDYLATLPTAPLNRETFERGYTVEAFFHLPAPWSGDYAWSSLFSREGMSMSAGKVDGDAEEPLVTLSLSGSRELQWCVYPTSMNTSLTNWGHELRVDRWWHVAVVNDGRHTTMYIDGCPVVRNPEAANRGLSTLNRRWLVGAYTYADKLDKVFTGHIGDLRIVGRALRPREFMNA